MTKALAIVQRLFGSEDRETLDARSRLAVTHKHMGSHELALSTCTEVMNIQRGGARRRG